MGGLRAAFTRNKKAAAVLGAVVVAGLALAARRRSAMGSASGTSTSSTSSTTTGYTVPASLQTSGAYDSTGTDVYNALQPQIEQLQQLARTIPVASPTPTVTTAAPAAPAAPVDPRQAAITQDYQTLLGRAPAPFEVNYWDATGQNLDQIRQGIVGSPEAQHRQ